MLGEFLSPIKKFGNFNDCVFQKQRSIAEIMIRSINFILVKNDIVKSDFQGLKNCDSFC